MTQYEKEKLLNEWYNDGTFRYFAVKLARIDNYSKNVLIITPSVEMTKYVISQYEELVGDFNIDYKTNTVHLEGHDIYVKDTFEPMLGIDVGKIVYV